MKAIERKLRMPMMTMAQRREMEAAGKIPGYNPLTRSPFLADIDPTGVGMNAGGMGGPGGNGGSSILGGVGMGASEMIGEASDVDVESLFGSKSDSDDDSEAKNE